MLEAPNLNNDAICASLQQHFGFVVTQLEFLPIGNDIGSYVYRVETSDGAIYFLKARRAPMYAPSVVVPHFLKDHGIAQVVAPLPTLTQSLWIPFDAFNLILYPFITGGSGMDVGLSDAQWMELGGALKKLHTVQLSPEILGLVQQESFERPYWVNEMHALQAKVDGGQISHNFEFEFVLFWKERSEQMHQLMARTLALGRALHNQPRAFVLCHSDIHTANVLVEPGGALHIVDWDQPILAPKERDLMFFGAGLGSLTGDADDAQHFYAGYGSITEIDRIAFAYYRYAWVMQDWVAYGAEVLLHEGLGEITRRNSLRQFKRMFDAGDVVDVAYASDRGTPDP
jgi:spectinomycin phosphotransferase